MRQMSKKELNSARSFIDREINMGKYSQKREIQLMFKKYSNELINARSRDDRARLKACLDYILDTHLFFAENPGYPLAKSISAMTDLKRAIKDKLTDEPYEEEKGRGF